MYSYMGEEAEKVEGWVYLGLGSQVSMSERGKVGKGGETACLSSGWQLGNLSHARRKVRTEQG